jgi:surfeit locus 1 family protein
MSHADYSFVRRPKWVAGHIIVLIAVAVFINMGFWQLRRLAERQDFNDRLLARTTVAEQPLDATLARYGNSQDDLELRIVAVTGTYRTVDEVILRAQSLNGISGHHVLTPLDLGDGRVLIVDRGWVPIDMDQPGQPEARPPAGVVDIHAALRKTQVRGSFGPVDPAEGTLTQIARVDLARLGQQIDGEVIPVFAQLLKQDPAQPGDLPALVPLPQPSEGSHRGYAVQWFLFAGVTLVGYPLLLRRTADARSTSSATASRPSSGP